MLPSIMIIGAAFFSIVALVVWIAMLVSEKSATQVEDRLSSLTGKGDKNDPNSLSEMSHLVTSQGENQGAFDVLLSNWFNLSLMFDQAKVDMTVTTFVAISAGLGVGATVVSGSAGLHLGIAPLVGACFGALPYMWLQFRKKARLKKFAAQLSDALELVSRALRAGHSLASGFHLVAQEMSAPVSEEFGRVFEEQNLGIPFEEALENLTVRIPGNLDLKFFVTAIILQRQTGGDLAEILDKIGHLIRERFKIWGQVQALTGEGRLSGIVLLALPPLLFLTVYRMNPDYLMLLFTDELGKKMLIGGLISQVIGALVIRKIVNIRV